MTPRELPPKHPIDIAREKAAAEFRATIKITEMPDQKTLEEFVRGMFGEPKVVFDYKEGKFIWTRERPDKPPVKP